MFNIDMAHSNANRRHNGSQQQHAIFAGRITEDTGAVNPCQESERRISSAESRKRRGCACRCGGRTEKIGECRQQRIRKGRQAYAHVHQKQVCGTVKVNKGHGKCSRVGCGARHNQPRERAGAEGKWRQAPAASSARETNPCPRERCNRGIWSPVAETPEFRTFGINVRRKEHGIPRVPEAKKSRENVPSATRSLRERSCEVQQTRVRKQTAAFERPRRH